MYRHFKASDGLSTDPEDSSLWSAVTRQAGSTRSSLQSRLDPSDRVVRIFISSTFKDFFAEREALVRTVFPALRQLCARHDLVLVDVDLRWGVPHDSSGTEAILTCLREIERCQEAGHSFFLGLVGHRYGWVPGQDDVEGIPARFQWLPDASVTLMEMMLGAIRPASSQALFALRSDAVLAQLPEDHLSAFKDADETSVKSLRRLLTSGEVPVFDYSCSASGLVKDAVTGRDRVAIDGLDAFCDAVLAFFSARIEERAQTTAAHCPVAEPHLALARTLARFTVGREGLVAALDERLDVNAAFLCLSGPAGAGKSTVMAQLVLRRLEKADQLFFHFAGAGGANSAEETLLERLRDFLSPDEPEAEVAALVTSRQRPLLILLDALDELTPVDKTVLSWLPPLPPCVRVIVSCLDSHLPGVLKACGADMVPVEHLQTDDALAVARYFFSTFGKKLDCEQEAALIAHEACTNPLWLTQACEELRQHGDHSSLQRVIQDLPSGLGDLNAFILLRASEDACAGRLLDLVRLLLVSRAGLLEPEARQLLAEGTGESVSANQWATLLHRASPFLHLAAGGALIRFKHRVIRESLAEKAFPNPEERKKVHSHTADFYSKQDTAASPQSRLKELPFHLFHAGRRQELVRWLRGKDSWFGHYPGLTRRAIMQNMRCRFNVMNTRPDETLRMCQFCTLGRTLSQFTPNESTCFICGQNAMSRKDAGLCPQHMNQRLIKKDYCFLCDRPLFDKKAIPVRLCQVCGFGDRCCGLLTESDRFYRRGEVPWAMPMIPHVLW